MIIRKCAGSRLKRSPFPITAFILLHFLGVICAFSQDSSTVKDTSSLKSDTLLVVGKVMLGGNLHTKDFVILREMSLRLGVPITEELLEYDKNRIYSLGLFNQVKLHVMPASPGVADLLVEVSERWYIFPFPVLGIKDRDWSKLFYGMGLLHSNFRGRNEKLYTTVVLGYDPSVVLGYRNPFLSDEGTYMLDGRLGFSVVRNKSLEAQADYGNFDEKHFSLSLSIGRRIGIRHTFWATGCYEIVSVSDYRPGRTLSPDGNDRFPIFGGGYVYDTRDLQEYPGSGSMARLSVVKFGLPGGGVDVIRYAADVRHYIPLDSRFVAAVRMFTDLAAAGKTPSYNRVYFGYGERIRGHFKEVNEGENIFGASAELHYSILSPRYFNISFMPPEFGVWKFGVVAVLFADAGVVWFRGMPPRVSDFARGYGVGMHFLLPYSAILRTQYAWNEVRKGEFIIDLGTAF